MAGVLVSVAVHGALLFLAYRTRVYVSPATVEVAPIAIARAGARRVMQAEQIVPVPDAVPAVEQPLTPTQERREEAEPQPGPGGPGTTAETADPWAGVAPTERLRPRMGDPRLWERAEAPPIPEPSDIERVRTRIADRLGAWNDSVAIASARARSATDWTYTDSNGDKWGVSPGKLHLGPLTLPLPVGLGAPSWKQDEARDRAAKDAEIADQGARSGAGENLEERAKAIRERKDRERGESKKKGGSGGS